MDPEESPYYKLIHDFFEANVDVLTSRSRGLDGSGIEASVNGFQGATQVTIKGLQALSLLHPFIESTLPLQKDCPVIFLTKLGM